MVLKACELLAIEPANAIVVGDSTFDRDSAAAAGVPFLAYRWDGGQRIDDLAELLEVVSSPEVL
jgi:phosphoglycolate phosphatase-like HAD superfamily hydrolase